MRYIVTFARYGFAAVEADSEEEALAKIEKYDMGNITWSDDFEITGATPDAKEEN